MLNEPKKETDVINQHKDIIIGIRLGRGVDTSATMAAWNQQGRDEEQRKHQDSMKILISD